MKKIVFIFTMMLAYATSIFAQNVDEQTNYVGSSKFTDNCSLKVGTGVVTSFNNMFDNGDVYQSIVVGVEKYFMPWFGVELEGRTAIGYGNSYNSHTAFDFVNVSGNAKFNLVNLFDFSCSRKTFEPVVFAGLGWGHATCSNVDLRNFMTFRTGAEVTFNFGANKEYGVMISPSVVWGDIHNGILRKSNGAFELSAAFVYHFKTSNGTHSFTCAKLYDQTEIDLYKAKINALRAELKNRKIEKVVEVKEIVKEVSIPVDRTFIVMFEKGKADLSNESLETLDAIRGKVKIVATASPEGTTEFNQKLSELRAQTVADYLKNRGVEVEESTGLGSNGVTSNRIAIITIL